MPNLKKISELFLTKHWNHVFWTAFCLSPWGHVTLSCWLRNHAVKQCCQLYDNLKSHKTFVNFYSRSMRSEIFVRCGVKSVKIDNECTVNNFHKALSVQNSAALITKKTLWTYILRNGTSSTPTVRLHPAFRKLDSPSLGQAIHPKHFFTKFRKGQTAFQYIGRLFFRRWVHMVGTVASIVIEKWMIPNCSKIDLSKRVLCCFAYTVFFYDFVRCRYKHMLETDSIVHARTLHWVRNCINLCLQIFAI
jgi:hypothetical protein